jgi:hypothetical protein
MTPVPAIPNSGGGGDGGGGTSINSSMGSPGGAVGGGGSGGSTDDSQVGSPANVATILAGTMTAVVVVCVLIAAYFFLVWKPRQAALDAQVAKNAVYAPAAHLRSMMADIVARLDDAGEGAVPLSLLVHPEEVVADISLDTQDDDVQLMSL